MGGQTVIIGAGPAGLAVAASLRERDLPFRLIDAGHEVGGSWRERYVSLTLHTARSLSALPGMPIPKEYGQWVRRDDLIAYLQEYARQFELFPEFGVRAVRVEPDGGDWRVTTTDGVIEARSVVVASGYSRTPYVPPWPGREQFEGSLTHTSDYRDPAPYAGQRVVVVGSGNSAADVVTDLVGTAGDVVMAVRTPPNIVRREAFGIPSQFLGIASDVLPQPVMNAVSGLLRKTTVPDLTAYGLPAPTRDPYTQFLRTRTVPILDSGFVEAVRSEQVRIVGAVESFTTGGVRLTDGQEVAADAVIAGTGFRPGLEPLVGDLGVLDDTGLPLVSGARTLPHAPRLHFIGIKVELTGLLREIRIESGQIAKALAGNDESAAGRPRRLPGRPPTTT